MVLWHTGRMSEFSADQFNDLLPASVGACISMTPPAPDCPLPAAEEIATRKMLPGRRREFAHGRECARQALQQLGEEVDAIPVGVQREPVWPAHIVGSISHCGNLAAAIVAQRFYFGGLGIDFEPRVPLHAETLSMICTPAEADWLATAEPQYRLLDAKLLFSAKESVYKCIWPVVQRFVDFPEVTLEIDRASSTFRARPNAADLPAPLFVELKGRFQVSNAWIVTIASLPPQAQADG